MESDFLIHQLHHKCRTPHSDPHADCTTLVCGPSVRMGMRAESNDGEAWEAWAAWAVRGIGCMGGVGGPRYGRSEVWEVRGMGGMSHYQMLDVPAYRVDASSRQANSTQYPAYNVVEGNHVAGVGVWNKQSAAFFKARA